MEKENLAEQDLLQELANSVYIYLWNCLQYALERLLGYFRLLLLGSYLVRLLALSLN